jgi:TRAP-type C4-dicarboxylate transport system substrate-binding protein
VRVNDSEILACFWEEMGTQPIVVPWHEVKAALRDGVVDVLPTHKAHLFPLGFCRHARFVTLLGDTSPALGVAMNELKYRVLPPGIQKALEDACDQAGGCFSELVRNAEDRNEALNISRYNAAYLKVDLTPWKQEAERIRKHLALQGQLPAEVADGVNEALLGTAGDGSTEGKISCVDH